MAAIDASAFRAHQVTEAIPKEWRDRAAKGWEYYLEEPIVANAINAWRTFALGDEVIFTSEDEAAETAARELGWRLKLQRFLRDMILQLLVKGECVGFLNRGTAGTSSTRTIAKLTCVNPTSIEPRYEDGELNKLDLKSGLVVPFYVTVETHGAGGRSWRPRRRSRRSRKTS